MREAALDECSQRSALCSDARGEPLRRTRGSDKRMRTKDVEREAWSSGKPGAAVRALQIDWAMQRRSKIGATRRGYDAQPRSTTELSSQCLRVVSECSSAASTHSSCSLPSRPPEERVSTALEQQLSTGAAKTGPTQMARASGQLTTFDTLPACLPSGSGRSARRKAESTHRRPRAALACSGR